MIRHPEPPPRALPLRVAIILIGTSVVLAVIGVSLTAWASAKARHDLAAKFKTEIGALEAQVTAMCQSTPDPATCKPVTQAPIVLVVPSTTMTTPTTTVPFPPSTLAPATSAPANPPASAAQAPSPAPEPTTTTTTAPPPPTTTPPTTAPCTSLPVVGCVGTKASRSSTRNDVQSTAYCLTGNMASGRPTYVGAVAGNQWPLGTVLNVSDSPWGPGQFTVEDRIGFGSELDFAIPGDCAAATQWGRRSVTTEVIS